MSHALQFMKLFEGFAEAHGTHGTTSKSDTKGGKLEIKKTARTIREPVTEQLWANHLKGTYPLGIIPIRKDSKCLWGCIDVDVYDMDFSDAINRIEKKKYPLVVCRSKSGGAHVFMFFAEPVDASDVRRKLREVAASMGWGNCEIFPKQTQVLQDKGDLGNWLNMPYLGGDDTERFAMKKTMAGMSVSEFLKFAEARRITAEELNSLSQPKVPDEGLTDGPPCLENLATSGFPEGTRNNGLFNVGIFCKKKYGSRWKEMVEQYNRELMNPPLPSDEVVLLIKNLEKQDYQYLCNDQPCVSFCNSTLCRTRKFGISGSAEHPIISGLSKLNTDEPLWFLDIDDTRIELTTKQLQNYRDFHAVCMDKLTRCYAMMKTDTWLKMVATAMESAQIIEAPQEVSVFGQFFELIEDFCKNRHRGDRPEDLLLGKPWFNEDKNQYFFRLRDLMNHLEREGFKSGWGRNKVSQRILDMGGGKEFLHIGERGVNVYWVPDNFGAEIEIPLPASKENPL